MVVALLLAWLSAAEAHRPGLARVVVDERGVTVAIARADLADGLPPGADPADVAWEAVGARTIVTSGGAPCALSPLGVAPLAPDGFAVAGALACPGAGPYVVRAPWLDRHPSFSAMVEAWGAPAGVLGGPDDALPVTPEPRWGAVAARFVLLGGEHILLGFDHVAFVLALVFGARALRDVLVIATGFTVAHSLTLALAVTGVVQVPSSVVEPLIALSIVAVAVENRLVAHLSLPRRAATAFGFGLVHGLGFAGALGEIGLPLGARAASLAAFNVGVELGQAAVVLAVWPLVAFAAARGAGDRLSFAGSAAVGLAGAWWLVERLT